MSHEGLLAAQRKMADAGVSAQAIAVFSEYYRQLEEGVSGLIAEAELEPLQELPDLASQKLDPEAAQRALAATVFIKLNGGLGTSMGMERAKSLLPVRDGLSFLDLTVAQVLAARKRYGVRLPLLWMNSFRTRADTLAALARHDGLTISGIPLDFMQSQEPKLLAETLEPASWPKDPSLEWCPPGHGDIYPALLSSGVLDSLISAGFQYASVSNSDNLGAAPSPELAAWFAESGAPMALEVCRRTQADRKGGHLARRKSDARLILRESAQTAEAEMVWFTDETRHPFFNTNNIWIDLLALSDALTASGAVLGLPLIRNVKNIDPTDPSSPSVYQVESAMGAAIEVFPGSVAIEVPRSRFLPVKTTNDLLLLRSDAYEIGPDAVPQLDVAAAPHVDLDPSWYRTLAHFEAHFPVGVPSLRAATGLTVRGDWTFGSAVVAVGEALLPDLGPDHLVPDGARIGPAGIEVADPATGAPPSAAKP